MAHLLFSRANVDCFKFPLKSSTTKIGRSEVCDIVLPEPEVSREHAAVFQVQGQYVLKKLGKAPVELQGEEVALQPLKGGERIQIGPWTAKFVVEPDIDQEEPTMTDEKPGKTQVVLGPASGHVVTQNLMLQYQPAGGKERHVSLDAEVFTIGAADKNDLVLNDPTVSSRHLKLVRQAEKIRLFDLGSTNGTFVNGVKVREAEIEPGFSVKVGETTLYLLQKVQMEKPKPISTDRFFGMIGASAAMQSLYGLVQKVAPIEATALILGESGTGKELVAHAIHRLSSRAKGPFIAINCGAISPELMESELFGHEKGAFTGAHRQHDGAVGQAAGGTLFLDEIGELSLELQPKLLRLLENQSYRRVGGTEELRADCRVVAATHQDLGRAVQEKRFREDLFFRLFVLPLVLQPLRNRKEDIPLLAEAFLKEFGLQGAAKRLDEAALRKLQAHAFPGNVRELKNALLRGFILAEGETVFEEQLSFSESLRDPSQESFVAGQVLEKLEEMEKKMVLKALQLHRWNKTKAAEALGVAKSTLFAKIKLYGLEEPGVDQ
jgi:DNA-binding NtrC family response regulator